MNVGDVCWYGKQEFPEEHRAAVNAIYASYNGWVCIGEFCYYNTQTGCLKTELKFV